MLSRRVFLSWIVLGTVALAATGALAFTLVKLGDVTDEARDLKDRLGQLKTRLAAIEDRPAPAAIDLRSLARRLERLEDRAGSGSRGERRTMGGPAATPGARGGLHTATASSDGGELPPALAPQKLLEAEPFKAGLQEMLKTGVKKTLEERRAKWYKRFDDRLQAEIASFAKANNLSEPQAQSMTAIIQEDRDQRREIRRQLRENELDPAAAKKQVDTLNANTRQRIVEAVGEQGYQQYQQQRQEQRQVWKSLRRGI